MPDSPDNRNPTPNQDRPPAQPVDQVTAAEASESPHITDVVVKKRSIGWRLVFIVTIAMLVIAAGIAASLVVSQSGSPIGGCLIMVIVAVAMPIAFLLANRRSERRIQRLLSQGHCGDLAVLVHKAAEQPLLAPKAYVAAHAVARELARCGRLGEVIRIQSKEPFELIQPLSVTFEPRLLEEADPAFEELSAAVSLIQDEPGALTRVSPNADDLLGLRRIKRNILLKGGRALVLLFAVFLIQAALESYQRGVITPRLLFWGLMFLLTLYGPARGGWFGTRQWLLAPASLIVRKARSRDETSQVRLFERRKSLLCIHQQRKGPWLVAVADAEACERTIATNAEVSLLLRAWLSPLKPPSVERLSDLR